MSTHSKPNKPMPSPAEINAYLEQSAARTKMRLPLAKGAALGLPAPTSSNAGAAPAEKSGSRALPVQGAKPRAAEPVASPVDAESPAGSGAAGWSPFTPDPDR
jgi:hypothetical protein